MSAVRIRSILLAALSLLLLAAPAFAAKYPQKAVNLTVPYSAGGSTDIVFRGLVDEFQKVTGQPLVIINKPGGPSVGMTEARTYAPDGYNLVVTPSAFAVVSALKVVPFDQNEFTHIANISSETLAFVVRGDSPWNNLKDLAEAAKKAPGAITVGVAGAGSLGHLSSLGVQKAADVKLTIVPFGGNNPALAALLGGHVSVATLHPSEYFAQQKAGKVKTICVLTPKRDHFVPDVPTAKEQGVNFAIDDIRWVAGPKGMPADVVKQLQEAFKKIVATQAYKDHANKMVFEVNYMEGDVLKKNIDELFASVKALASEVKK
ncbi:tripartite tricarboxylate transporter substrate binding protein [Desulfovibrio sp. OttesenSCG-928-O18]|nr:tripartite tricarboxylate transporter substrate binding protein [Desulfovibrio sp. OttesenSCG-928-O18]